MVRGPWGSVGTQFWRLEAHRKICVSGEIQKFKASLENLERRFKAE